MSRSIILPKDSHSFSPWARAMPLAVSGRGSSFSVRSWSWSPP